MKKKNKVSEKLTMDAWEDTYIKNMNKKELLIASKPNQLDYQVFKIASNNKPFLTISLEGKLIINTENLTIDEVAREFLDVLEKMSGRKINDIEVK